MAVKLSFEGEVCWERLQSRYPAIAAELCFSPYEQLALFYDANSRLNALLKERLIHSEEIEAETQTFPDVDVLYVYGIGLGYFYLEMKHWLHEKKTRQIVFFEESLSVLDAAFRMPFANELLDDVQVHLYYVPYDEMWPGVLEECVHKWMSDRIEWTSLKFYTSTQEKKIRALKLKLLRKSACIHAKVGEALHYPLLMENIAANLKHLPKSFHANQMKGALKNVPAIICGAGYSLSLHANELKNIQQKALMISGGSAITAMAHYGISPHMAMAVDPNEEEYERLKTLSCFETPFIYSSRLHKEVLSSTNLQLGYLCSNTGGLFEAWMHEKLGIHFKSFALDLGEEALSVTTLAVAFAVEMGCNPIVLCGVDLAYTNKQRYCPGVMSSSSVSLKELERVKRSRDQMVRRKNGEGAYVYTLIKWVMEAACLGEFAKKNTKTSFFNLSSKGLPIPHIPFISWEELSFKYLSSDLDIKGLLHASSHQSLFEEKASLQLEEGFLEALKSFERSLPLFDQMIEEIERKKTQIHEENFSFSSGKMLVIEMDLLEEPAYEICFQQIFSVYQGMLDWWDPSKKTSLPEERLSFLAKKEKLWSSAKLVGERCHALLKSC